MLFSTIFTLAAASLAGARELRHMNLHRQVDTSVITPDGSCGVIGDVTYTCAGSGFGGCCSGNGVCGYDETSCSVASGCNIAYGRCDAVSSSSSSTSTASTTSTPTTTITGTIMPFPISNSSSTASPTGTGPMTSSQSGTELPTGISGNSTMMPATGMTTSTPAVTSGPTGSGLIHPIATSVGTDGVIGTYTGALDQVCYIHTRVHTVTYSS